MSADNTWDDVRARFLSVADEAGVLDLAVSVESTIAALTCTGRPCRSK
jgi:hypothetical protein